MNDRCDECGEDDRPVRYVPGVGARLCSRCASKLM